METEADTLTSQELFEDQSVLADIDLLAQKIASPLLEKIHLLERAGDRLVQELARSKTAHAEDVAYYIEKGTRLQEEKTLLEERVAELLPRPPAHKHDPDEPQPVLVFDLDGTLKRQIRRGDGGNYPMTDDTSVPFPGVKKWMDRWKSLGACIHINTAGLYYGDRQDLEVYDARLQMIQGWYARYGLPIDLVLPKVPSDVFLDDRMIEVPGNPSLNPGVKFVPDWDQIGEECEKRLGKRFDVINGIWVRKDKHRIGKEIEEWPDPKQYRDYPRGYSGPRVDVDIHRTLSKASSSLRVAPPQPGAVEAMRNMYEGGLTLRVSCAGWNPKTHTIVDALRRLAGIRQWLLQWSIPYDRVVTKDHGDLYFDDKGLQYTDWTTALPRIWKKLPMKLGDQYAYGN